MWRASLLGQVSSENSITAEFRQRENSSLDDDTRGSQEVGVRPADGTKDILAHRL